MSFRLPCICNLKLNKSSARMPDATSIHHCLMCHPCIECATALSDYYIYISAKKSYYNEDLGLLTKVQKQERGDF